MSAKANEAVSRQKLADFYVVFYSVQAKGFTNRIKLFGKEEMKELRDGLNNPDRALRAACGHLYHAQAMT